MAAANSAAGESSTAAAPVLEEKVEEIFEPLGIKIEQLRRHDVSASEREEASGINVEERQFISTFVAGPLCVMTRVLQGKLRT